MLTLFSKFVSFIVHPIFIPIYGLFLLFNSGLYISFSLSEAAKNTIYLIVLLNTVLIPGCLMLFLYKKGYITSLMAEEKQERPLLYVTIIIFYYCTYKLFESYSIPLVSAFVLGATISIFILLITNFFLKTSAHMVGMGGILGMLYLISELLLGYYSWLFIPIIILTGIVAFSRLKLNAHKPIEIYLGLIIGFVSEYLTVYYSLLF